MQKDLIKIDPATVSSGKQIQVCFGCGNEFVMYKSDTGRFHNRKCYLENMHKVNKGQKCSDQTKAKISKANKGSKRSDATRRQMSESAKKRKSSDVTKAKISKAGKGRIVSEATRAKISAGHKSRSLPGSGKGRKLSEKTLARMRKAAAKRIQEGKSHSYGKSGHIYLERFDTRYHYRSSYEKKALEMINEMESIVDLKVENLNIDYVDDSGCSHYYIPDMEITYVDGTVSVIEVKPNYALNERINQLKFEAAEKYCSKHNKTFIVWTEDILFEENSL